MGSGFERYPLLRVMGVDVAVEKRRCGAYISVCVFMVVSPPTAHAQTSSALLYLLLFDTAHLHPCDGSFSFSRYTAIVLPPRFDYMHCGRVSCSRIFHIPSSRP